MISCIVWRCHSTLLFWELCKYCFVRHTVVIYMVMNICRSNVDKLVGPKNGLIYHKPMMMMMMMTMLCSWRCWSGTWIVRRLILSQSALRSNRSRKTSSVNNSGLWLCICMCVSLGLWLCACMCVCLSTMCVCLSAMLFFSVSLKWSVATST